MLLVPFALAALLVMLSGCAAESRAASDPLPRDLRQRVDALRSQVSTVATTPTNLAERAGVIWDWANALVLAGKRIPDSLPSDVGLAVIYTTEGKVAGGSELSFEDLCKNIDRYVHELELIESAPEAFGVWSVADDKPLAARSFASIDLRYTVGSRGFAEGGAFLIGAQGQIDAAAIQIEDPKADGYTSIESSNAAARFTTTSLPLTGLHGGNREARKTPAFKLEGDALAARRSGRLPHRRSAPGLARPRGADHRHRGLRVPDLRRLRGQGPVHERRAGRASGRGRRARRPHRAGAVGGRDRRDRSTSPCAPRIATSTAPPRPIPAWEVVRDGKVVEKVAAGGPALQLRRAGSRSTSPASTGSPCAPPTAS